MQGSSLASRIKRCVAVREWQWWQLPLAMRFYVAAAPVATVVVIGVEAAHTHWTVDDAVKFLLLMCCGIISVAFTPRSMYRNGGVIRDFATIWVLPIAILLPPIYASLAPIPLVGTLQLFVHRGVFHRRVFTAASFSLTYTAVSVVFRWFPQSFAGSHVGTDWHALTWAVAVATCEVIAGRAQHFLVVGAVKISNPKIKVIAVDLSPQALESDFLKMDLCVLITLGVALSPAMVIVAIPLVFLVRRFLEYPVLVAQSRTDAKTGLLNVGTWESEAEAELSRATRLHQSLAVALIDIDHFKVVNDTYGHLVGDRVLKAIAEALGSQSRDYDRTGRFGGEEFVLLLAQTGIHDACNIADRLRRYVAAMAIPIDDRPNSPVLNVTISIGVTAMQRGENFELTDLLAAADSAMYAAKHAGRNRVAYAMPLHDMGLYPSSAEPAPVGSTGYPPSTGRATAAISALAEPVALSSAGSPKPTGTAIGKGSAIKGTGAPPFPIGTGALYAPQPPDDDSSDPYPDPASVGHASYPGSAPVGHGLYAAPVPDDGLLAVIPTVYPAPTAPELAKSGLTERGLTEPGAPELELTEPESLETRPSEEARRSRVTSPLSHHRVVLFQTDHPTTSLCPKR
jgi:diguanylate cyclase (GGDEF)-like protein